MLRSTYFAQNKIIIKKKKIIKILCWHNLPGPNHGMTDAIIRDGTIIFLTTYMGFYKIPLKLFMYSICA